MISREDRHAVHEFIVLDLAVRSLQYDYVMFETLKMKKFYIRMIDPVLKELQKDYYNRKRLLAKRISVLCAGRRLINISAMW